MDVSGLSPQEISERTGISAYVDRSPDPGKMCSLCVLYVPAAPNACGACKVVKGPIHPKGTCKLFVAKPA